MHLLNEHQSVYISWLQYGELHILQIKVCFIIRFSINLIHTNHGRHKLHVYFYRKAAVLSKIYCLYIITAVKTPPNLHSWNATSLIYKIILKKFSPRNLHSGKATSLLYKIILYKILSIPVHSIVV